MAGKEQTRADLGTSYPHAQKPGGGSTLEKRGAEPTESKWPEVRAANAVQLLAPTSVLSALLTACLDLEGRAALIIGEHQ